jgi:hypothetical protein
MIKKQFTLYLRNRPGELARVTRKLASSKVNIEGISVAASTDVGLVQLVPSNARAAKAVFAEMSIPFTTQDVALLRLKNQAGSLSKVATKLAKDGVNISYIYATGCDCSSGCDCYVVISAPELDKVEAAWKSL